MKSKDDRRGDRDSGPKPLAGSAARRVEAIIEGAEKAAERVIDEAEERAREYLAEAEAAADRTVAKRLAALGELTDALVAQADAIRRQSELLTNSLREAKERLESEGVGVPGHQRAEAEPPLAGSASSTADATSSPTERVDAGRREPAVESGEPVAEDDGAGADLSEAPRTPHLSAVEPSEPSPPGETEAGPVDQIAERRGHGTPAGARLLATQMAVSGSSREEIAARLRTGFEIEDTDAILDAILGPEA